MPATFEPIATTTLSSAANSITFSSIPATYTDLRLVIVGRTDSSSDTLNLRFNNISAGDPYSQTHISGTGASASSGRLTDRDKLFLIRDDNFNSTTYGLVTVDIFDYRNTSVNKTCLIETSYDKNGSGVVNRIVALMRMLTAINRIDVGFLGAATNLGVGTTATLYGILKA